MIINTDFETMFFYFQCYESPPDCSDTEDLDVNFGTKRKRGFVSRLLFLLPVHCFLCLYSFQQMPIRSGYPFEIAKCTEIFQATTSVLTTFITRQPKVDNNFPPEAFCHFLPTRHPGARCSIKFTFKIC